jgi:hypothetical protein
VNEPTDHRRAELVNAFLDGDLAPDERARVAADPELAAAVAEATRLRQLLAAVPPASAESRERAVAAALAAFDADATDGPGRDDGTVVAIRRRRRPALLAAAAAVVVIAGAGIAIGRRGGGTRHDDVAEQTSLTTADRAAPSATVAAGAVLGAADAPASASVPTAGTTAPRVVDSPEALAALGAEYAAVPGVDAQDAAVTCLGADTAPLAPIIYRGTPALAVRLSDGTIAAIDPAAGCEVLASTGPERTRPTGR